MADCVEGRCKVNVEGKYVLVGVGGICEAVNEALKMASWIVPRTEPFLRWTQNVKVMGIGSEDMSYKSSPCFIEAVSKANGSFA